MESDRNAAILAEIFADSDSEMEIDTENDDETTDDESSNDGDKHDKAASSGMKKATVFPPLVEHQVGLLSQNAFIVYVCIITQYNTGI